jgi:hypothetical protein
MLVHMDQHEKLTFHPFSVISEYDLDPNCGSYPKFCNKNSLMGGCSLHEKYYLYQLRSAVNGSLKIP